MYYLFRISISVGFHSSDTESFLRTNNIDSLALIGDERAIYKRARKNTEGHERVLFPDDPERLSERCTTGGLRLPVNYCWILLRKWVKVLAVEFWLLEH